MRRAVRELALLGLLVTSSLTTRAFAQDSTDAPADQAATEPKPVEPAPAEPAPAKAAVVPGKVSAPAPDAAAPAAKPKIGDTTFSGYLRAGFGASSKKGRMTCFSLKNPQSLFSKYRLGNECEVWGEFHFTTVAYAADDGVVAHLHFMPTVYIPTTYIGYSPNGATSVPDQNFLSTGATVQFPNLYADITGIKWLHGGTAWVGTRYYKRESVYISDFFYWNPSGVGAGIEDVDLGYDMKLSYAAFAVDGETVSAATPVGAPPLPARVDLGIRNDVQLRGFHPWTSGELQLGVQGIINYSDNPASHGGWGVTLQYVQKLLGGDNRLALQYGRGGGTGFGTLSRFYYPDFSVRHDLSEGRFRAVDVLTIQPVDWFSSQVAFVYQHDQNFLGSSGQTADWFSAGTRLAFAFTRHAKFLTEVGYDQARRNNGSNPQYLAKFTPALAITADRSFWARPELRVFYTYALWNSTASGVGVDSGDIYRNTDDRHGSTFGVQGETWW